MKKLIIEADIKLGCKNRRILRREKHAFHIDPNELDDAGLKNGDKVKVTIERIK